MGNKSLYFELFAIAFLLVTGAALLMSDLPGWGLISIAGILSALSFGLRKAATSDSKQPSNAFSSSHSLASEAA